MQPMAATDGVEGRSSPSSKQTCLRRIITITMLFATSVLAAALVPSMLRLCSCAGDPSSVQVQVWTASLFVCSYIFSLIVAVRHSRGAFAAFTVIPYSALLARVAAGLLEPRVGITVAHLITAWAAGLLGRALAEHRLRTAGGSTPDEEDEEEVISPELSAGIVRVAAAMCAVASAAWAGLMAAFVFPASAPLAAVFALAYLVSGVVYIWVWFVSETLLRGALLPPQKTACSSVLLFVASGAIDLVARESFAYVLLWWLSMMAAAAILGYTISLHTAPLLVARDQTLAVDLELGMSYDENISTPSATHVFRVSTVGKQQCIAIQLVV